MMRLSALVLLSSFAAPLVHAETKQTGAWGWLTYSVTDPATNAVMAALILFLLIVWRIGAFKFLATKLDERADSISAELDQARSLREQAAEALALAERRQKDADQEAAAIIDQAKTDAKQMMIDARADLDLRLKRREAMAETRIARAEAEAVDDVRNAAADAATQAARRLIEKDSAVDQFELAAKEIEKAI